MSASLELMLDGVSCVCALLCISVSTIKCHSICLFSSTVDFGEPVPEMPPAVPENKGNKLLHVSSQQPHDAVVQLLVH